MLSWISGSTEKDDGEKRVGNLEIDGLRRRRRPKLRQEDKVVNL